LASNTIIGAAFEPVHPLRSLLLDQAERKVMPDEQLERRLFKIRTADAFGQRSAANILMNRMYATRGYRSTALASTPLPHITTLMATENHETIGTISIGFDSESGLLVEQLFAEEVASLRQAGRRLCEFTKLAMDSVVRSKRVLASLFHVAYILAHRIRRVDDLLIEVNPRHVRYYEKMLGFHTMGPERHNPRVDAPAVLLRLDFAHAHAQIDRFGGRPDLADRERSLYPYFFSVPEEAGIVGRLSAAEPSNPAGH
jgi:hypothetical protein